MKKTPAFLAQTLAMTLAFGFALSAQAAGQKPKRDFSSQLNQAAGALLGDTSLSENGAHFYQGRNRKGQACLVTVQYGPGDVSVEIKAQGAGVTHEELLDADIPAKSSDITSIEVNSNSNALGVEIQEEITPYHETRVDHYAYSVHADLDSSASGLGRLSSLLVSRNEKGQEASAECGNLRPILALTQSDVDSLGDQARTEYLRRNPGDSVGAAQDIDVSACAIDGAQSITCDVSLATDYTPDTLHVTYEIKNGALGSIKDFDFEPGC